ncbi:hypothetical protein U0035_04680 [Niabella yanshanensis]|uniref:Uncharacterized protein n=1 Tax=Niabella yanshanensis TaxID=577386 RepID=A0ABZ0W834_9BACT|nr:hypothetical protein [Niabella yanshanensis]WQD39440.1 hypothetical protein U0035_04680 [Niabella yanshanensis]
MNTDTTRLRLFKRNAANASTHKPMPANWPGKVLVKLYCNASSLLALSLCRYNIQRMKTAAITISS